MVKYATNRKRSYKKRRMIRKLKRTMRRKIHMVGGGGSPEEVLFQALFPLVLKVLPGVFKLLMENLGPFLQILILLGKTASYQRGGSKMRSYQRGGGLSQSMKTRLISILNDLKINFQNKNKPDVVACIDTLIKKFEAEKVDPNGYDPSKDNVDISTSDLQTELNAAPAAAPEPASAATSVAEVSPDGPAWVGAFKQKLTEKITNTLNSKLKRIESKFTTDEYKCLITLKDAVLADVRDTIKNKFNDLIKELQNLPGAGDAINLYEKAAVVLNKVNGFAGQVRGGFNTVASSENGQAAAAKLGNFTSGIKGKLGF